jgi:hypothetical protein
MDRLIKERWREGEKTRRGCMKTSRATRMLCCLYRAKFAREKSNRKSNEIDLAIVRNVSSLPIFKYFIISITKKKF